MQLSSLFYSSYISDLLASYYRMPDHPCKLRFLTWLEKSLGNRKILVKTRQGFRFAVDQIDYIQRTVFQTREWESEVGALLKQQLSKDDVFFDIGANTGYFSCFTISCDVKLVVAFEPRSDLRDIFVGNMKVNHFNPKQWLLRADAISDKMGQLYYHSGSIYNSGQGRLSNTQIEDNDSIVSVDCLDNIIYREKIPYPTVLKLDIEGWEINALNGARKLFSDNPPKMVIFEAYCDPSGEILDKNIVGFFNAYNYSIHHITRAENVILENENYMAFKQT